MKLVLIALNVFLAAAVAHLAWTYSSEPLEFASTSRKVTPAKIEKKKTVRVKAAEKAVMDSPEVTEQKIAAMLEHNIFKTERVPEAPANKNAQRNSQQIRADLSLVGTYVIGDSLGAIILQRIQGNAQQQLKALQQKEYEQYALSANRITDPKKKAEAAAAAEKGAAEEEKKEAAEVSEEKDPKQIVIVGGNPSISANNVFRQHLKVGDTTVTGYKLEEVTRTSAVLTKNNERIELTLLTPSEAGNVARQRQNNNQNKNNNNNNQNNNNRNNQNNNNNNRNNNNNNARNNNNNNRNNNNARNNNNNRNNNRDDWF